MGVDVFVEEESNWKGETRWEHRSLIRRQEGMNPELRWRVHFRIIDLRLSWSRRGGGRERWRCRESVSFTHISCQFHLQHYSWRLQRAARRHPAGLFLSPPGTRPSGSGWLAASCCPSCSESLHLPASDTDPVQGAPLASTCSSSLSFQQTKFSWADFSSKI